MSGAHESPQQGWGGFRGTACALPREWALRGDRLPREELMRSEGFVALNCPSQRGVAGLGIDGSS